MKQKSLEKRLASERRKEVRKVKSREAARCRRGKETEVFADLTDSLPVPEHSKATLDKTSIIRLSINYMKVRDFFANICSVEDTVAPVADSDSGLDDVPELVDNMHNFVLIVTPSFEIIYVTDNVRLLLGLSQYDVIGNRMGDFVHPCDIQEVESNLKSKDSKVNFIARFKTILLPKGRVVNLKSASYKAIKFTGQRLHADIKPAGDVRESAQPLSECIVLTGLPMAQPGNLEENLDCMTFASTHSMDMKFIDCDAQVAELAKYPAEAVLGTSLYDVVHGTDMKQVEKRFKTLYSKGQTMTDLYRMLTYGGGYVWAVTQASVVYNQKTSKPQQIVCVHHVLSRIMEPELVMAKVQLPSEKSSVRVKGQPSASKSACHIEACYDDAQSDYADDIVALTASMFTSNLSYTDSSSADLSDDIFSNTARMFDSSVGDIQTTTSALFDPKPSSSAAGLFNEMASSAVDSQAKPDLEALVDTAGLNSGLLVDTSGIPDTPFDEEFFMRAPYIPMDTQNDVNLLDSYYPSDIGLSCASFEELRQQYSPDSTYGEGSPLSSPYSDQDVNIMSRAASSTSIPDGAQPTVVNAQRNVATPQNKQMEHIRLHQGGRTNTQDVGNNWTQPDALAAYLSESMYCQRAAAGGGSNADRDRNGGMKRKIEEPTPIRFLTNTARNGAMNGLVTQLGYKSSLTEEEVQTGANIAAGSNHMFMDQLFGGYPDWMSSLRQLGTDYPAACDQFPESATKRPRSNFIDNLNAKLGEFPCTRTGVPTNVPLLGSSVDAAATALLLGQPCAPQRVSAAKQRERVAKEPTLPANTRTVPNGSNLLLQLLAGN